MIKKLGIKNLKSQNGYSLIELALYLGLLSILIVILVELFVSSLKIQLDSQSTSTLSQDSRYILNKLSYDLINAQSVSNPSSVGDTSTSLNFINSNGSNYSYNLDELGNLTIFTGNAPEALNSVETKVSNVSFLKLGNGSGKDSIQVKFTLTSRTARTQGEEKKDFQTTILLR